MRWLFMVALAGCATNNVAELAEKVRVVDGPEEARGCRQVGIVKGEAMTETGARERAQRHALYLGGNLLLKWTASGMYPLAVFGRVGQAWANLGAYRGGFIGYVFECDRLEPLAGQLTGVTFVGPSQITVSPDEPRGCDALGPPVEAFSDGRPGSAEDGLRRLATLASANYVRIVKQLDYDGRPALRGQPYACAVSPGREAGKLPVE